MRRFVYAPDVHAYIATDSGILDVSPDIISGSVTRRRDAASQATLTLQNPYRKYLRKLKSMDRLVIYLTRVKPMLVFSGYLDNAPIDQLYPEPVTIKASCTIKRLLHTYWDPQLPYVTKFFMDNGWTFDPLTGNIYDITGKTLWNMDINSSIGHMLRVIMNKVGNWPIGLQGENKNTVHILKLPDQFISNTKDLIAKEIGAVAEQRADVEAFLKQLLTVQGIFSDPFGTGTPDFNLNDAQTDSNPLPQSLAGTYRATIYGPPYSLSGFAAALYDECQTSNDSDIRGITHAQAQNAATIVEVVRARGFNVKAAAGWVAAAWPESKLRADAVNPSSNATGLFQLLSGGYYGVTGVLHDIVLQKTGKSVNPQRGGVEAKNPTYNTLAILTAANATGTINAAAEPHIKITDLYIRPSDAEKAANNYPNSIKFFQFAYAAIQKASENTTNQGDTDSGVVGDVRVGNARFLKVDHPHNETTGYTFKIKSNPYDNDGFIFRAVKYDPTLKPDQIAIYVPGAKDRSSPQAQNWTNGNVSLETSINQAARFPTPTTGSSAPAQIDPKKMTQAQLTGGGVSTAGLKPITIAALAFIQTNFGPFKLTAGYATTGHVSNSDHARGLAMDLVPIDANGNQWTSDGITRTDALAQWAGFVDQGHNVAETGTGAQPETDGNPITRWVGWRHTAGHGPPTGPGATTSSSAHIHISFLQSADIQDMPGTDGTPGAGGAQVLTSTTLGATGVQINQQNLTEFVASIGIGLPLVFPLAADATESALFKGERALMNDQALIEFVQFMCKSSGRSFQSMPNGDFLAFYPDYFNWSGETPYFKIADIETQGDLTIYMSDDQLATHVFTTADSFSVNGAIDITDKLASTVASIESVAAFRNLVNVGPEFDATAFLKRYGARPLTKEVPEIKDSFMQFMFGWMTFLEQWAKLFTANPTFTFMPELYPGGLVEFDSKDLVMFIDSVTHNFDRSSGFTTTAELIAPSTRTKQTNFWSVISAPTKAKKK